MAAAAPKSAATKVGRENSIYVTDDGGKSELEYEGNGGLQAQRG